MIPATRQKLGTVNTAGGGSGSPSAPTCGAPRCPPGGGGGVNTPADTGSAIVIVVFGSEIDFRPAHGVAARAAPKSMAAMFAIINFYLPDVGENYHKSS